MNPLIEVEYQSRSTVVLKGDEDLLLLTKGTLTPFWHAIDIVKKEGYSLEHYRIRKWAVKRIQLEYMQY